MLTGRARDYYFDPLGDKKLMFVNVTASIKRRFIAAKHEQTLVQSWDNLILYADMAGKAGKPRQFCIEFFVSCMHELQCGLSEAYHNIKIFHTKVIYAVKVVNSCKLTYFNTANSI